MGQTTGNFLAGNATLTSSDGSIAIDGGPAQGQIDFKLATPALQVGLPIALVSSEINLLATAAGVPLLGRAGTPFTAPGRLFVPFNARWLSLDIDGTVGASGGVFNAGNNAGKTNVFVTPTPITPANWNFIGATPLAAGGWVSVILPNGQPLCNMGTPILVDVTTPANLGTATVLHARLMVAGYLF